MELFQKAIQNDFERLNYEEITEIFPLLYYTLPNLTEYLSIFDLSYYQTSKILKLSRTLDKYVHEVPIETIFEEIREKTSTSRVALSQIYTCNDFEGNDNCEEKFRILINEILKILNQADNTQITYCNSEILNNVIYHPTIKLIICVIVHEHPLMWKISNIVKCLLHCMGGLELIKSLALNFPHEWHSICYAIIDRVDKIPSQTRESSSMNTSASFIYSIKSILDLNPSHIYSIFEYCLKKLVLPELVLTVALDLSNDGQLSLLDFLKLVLLDDNQKTCKWFTKYLKSKKESDLLGNMKEKLGDLAKSFIEPNDEEMKIGNVVDAQLLLRIIGALRTFADFKFDPELSYSIMKIITHKLPIKPASVELIKVSIGFVLLFKASFTYDSRYTLNFDPTVSAWLRHLLVIQSEFNSRLPKSYSEFLLLLVLIYNTQRISEVEKVLEQLFGFQIRDHSLKMNAKMITQDVFVDKVVASLAASVPVNSKLNNKMTGHLPINCVLQLMKTRSFARNRVEINNWIFKQVRESIAPIHPKLVTLLKNFIDSLLPTDNCDPNIPISEKDILSLFTSPPLNTMNMCSLSYSSSASNIDCNSNICVSSQTDLTPHILMFYYLLYLYEVYTQRLTHEFVVRNYDHVNYSTKLWRAIPVRYILVYVENRKIDYHDLYPSLLRLVTKFYPHVVCGDCNIQDEILYKHDLLVSKASKMLVLNFEDTVLKLDREYEQFNCSRNPIIKTSPLSIMSSSKTQKLLKYLEELSNASAEYLVPFAELIVEQMASVIDLWEPSLSVSMILLKKYTKIWIKLHLIMTRRLELITINQFQHQQVTETDFLSILKSSEKSKLTEDDILENPIEILLVNVKKQIFRCVPILDIYLRILESQLLHSNYYWYNFQINQSSSCSSLNPMQQQFNINSSSKFGNSNAHTEALKSRKHELDTLRKSLLQNQAATIIQMLLEKCLLRPDEEEEIDKINILAVQKVICSFIHSMFINDQDLCHIVHWQSYPREILSIAVQGIPSMHITLDTLEKNFLNSGDYTKLIFMLDLQSHIGRFYNVKKAQDETTKLVDYFQSIVQTIAGTEERAVLIWLSIEPMIRIGTTFPNLLTTVSSYLLTTASICAALCSVMDNHIVIYDNPDFTGDITDEEFSEFDVDDQYHLCYCKIVTQHDEMMKNYLPQSNVCS